MTGNDRSGPAGLDVLITGGAGFIGSHLAERLAPRNEVRVLDTLSNGRADHVPGAATLIEGDIRDPATVREAVTGSDVVYHLAAVVSVDRSIDRPLDCHAVNVDGALTVLDAARTHGVRTIVTSSAAVYGVPAAVPITEAAPKHPISPYGLDKLAIDEYATLFHDLYGLETIVLRPFNVYGPRQSANDYSGVISTFLEQATHGEPLTVHGDGTQTRDFVHVRDVVRAFCLAATTDAIGEAFNVGTGSSVTINELAEVIRSATQSTSEIVHTEPRPGDIDQSCADISSATNRLGFEPRIGLREGIETLADGTN